MSVNKFESNSYCVGGKQYSRTTNIKGDITPNGRKMLIGKCGICNRKKSMLVSDNTRQAEGSGKFFKNLGKASAKAGKKLATNVLKNPGRALEVGANIGSAAVFRNPKAALSTIPDVIKFYHTGKGLYLGKFV